MHVEEAQRAGLGQVAARHERRPRRMTLKRRRHREVVRQLPPGAKHQIVQIQIAALPDLERIAELAVDEGRPLLEAHVRAFPRGAIVDARRHYFRRRAESHPVAEHPQQTDRLEHLLVDDIRLGRQPPYRSLDLRPPPAVPAEHSASEHARRVVVEPVDRIETVRPVRAQEVTKAQGFAGGQEREQRTFVLGRTGAKQRPEQGRGDRMERPAGIQVTGELRPVPARAVGDPGSRGGNDTRPGIGRGSLRGTTNGCRGETDHLIAAFTKRELAEAALHFRPLVPVGRTQLVGVVLDRLMQDGQNHERDAAGARGDFRKGLQQVDVASRGLLRGVLQPPCWPRRLSASGRLRSSLLSPGALPRSKQRRRT